MTYEEFITHLDVKKNNGKSALCICPAHNDSSASLSVTDAGDKILIRCHAGCTHNDIVLAMGLSLNNLFQSGGKGKKYKQNLLTEAKSKVRGFALADSYDYFRQGILYATKFRYIRFVDGKRQKTDRWFNHKSYKWVQHEKGTNPKEEYLIYNSQVLDVKYDSASGEKILPNVIITEGEKDCDSVSILGLDAITTGGSSSWDEKYAALLKDRVVLILRDNDKAGVKYAINVWKSLQSYAKKIVCISISNKDGGDITDWIDEGHTYDEFIAFIRDECNHENLASLVDKQQIYIDEESISKSKKYEMMMEQKKKDNQLYQERWIEVSENGKASVNVGILSDHIKKKYHYMIVKKRGADKGNLHIYVDGYYKLCGADDMYWVIEQHIPVEIITPGILEQVYKLLISSIKHQKSFDEVNKYENLINFKNGIFNIDTWKLESHDPKYIMTQQRKVNYNPDAEYENHGYLDSCLQTLAPDEEVRNSLLEFCGLTLSNIPGYRVKKALHQYGPGDVGKTQIRALMEEIIGQEYVNTTPLEKLEKDSHSLAYLYGMRIYGNCDESFAKAKSLEIFKQITGGDSVHANPKGKDPFSFKYDGIVWTIGNDIIRFGGDKGAHVYERMNYVETPKGTKIKKDRNFTKKLLQDIEYATHLFMKHLKILIENNLEFSAQDHNKALRENHAIENDSAMQFINESFIITGDDADFYKRSSFNEYYAAYCEKTGEYREKNKYLKSVLEEMFQSKGFKLRIGQKKITSVNAGICIIGIKENPRSEFVYSSYGIKENDKFNEEEIMPF